MMSEQMRFVKMDVSLVCAAGEVDSERKVEGYCSKVDALQAKLDRANGMIDWLNNIVSTMTTDYNLWLQEMDDTP